MPTVSQLQDDVLSQGDIYFHRFELFDTDGNPVDMTEAGRRFWVNWRHEDGAVTVTRDTAIAGDVIWSDQPNGKGSFLMERDETVEAVMPEGRYTVEGFYEDTGPTPTPRRLKGTGTLYVRRPITETFS